MPDNHKPTLSAILALDQHQLIGSQGQLPWHLPADLQHFKKTTLNHPVIMGRKTYESIGKPLPMRTNIILTHDQTYAATECLIAHTTDEAIRLAQETNTDEIFVIGGAEIYQSFMPLIKRLYITEIAHSFLGDTYFKWNKNEWVEVAREHHAADEKNSYEYTFCVYERTI